MARSRWFRCWSSKEEEEEEEEEEETDQRC